MSATRPLALARSRWHVVVVLGLLVAGLASLVAVDSRLQRIHAYGWEWTLSPSAAPPKVRFEGRDYRRGHLEPGGLPTGYRRVATTLGHGRIYTYVGNPGASTGIFVEDGARVYGYGLLGGP